MEATGSSDGVSEGVGVSLSRNGGRLVRETSAKDRRMKRSYVRRRRLDAGSASAGSEGIRVATREPTDRVRRATELTTDEYHVMSRPNDRAAERRLSCRRAIYTSPRSVNRWSPSERRGMG